MDSKNIENHFNSINYTLLSLTEEIKLLRLSIDLLNQSCSNISQSTQHMDSLITNVENVYESVRLPLSFIKNKINIIFGSDDIKTELPQLK